jgi:diacylglycerol kinase (ATP)
MKPLVHKVAILINNSACQGKARHRWQKIREQVLKRFPAPPVIIEFEGSCELDSILKELILKQGVNGLISGGGDGSLHFLINALLKEQGWRAKDIAVGAIGLGSSNDFHKPMKDQVEGIPIRINTARLMYTDVGKVRYTNGNGQTAIRHFLINAGFGVTAEGNQFFNHPGPFLRLLKRYWTQGAILFTALKTIFSHRNFPVQLCYNSHCQTLALSNLAVLKNPNISGNLRYDQVIHPNDGRLGLNYGYELTFWELLQLLIDLGKGHFTGRPKRFSDFIQSLEIEAPQTVPLEMDGEIIEGKNFSFSLLPKGLKLMT